MLKGFFPEFIYVTIESYLDEIEANLCNKQYLSALSLSLMLPDICRDLLDLPKGRSQYVEWVNKYVSHNYETKHDAFDVSDFNGHICYALRCAVLHSGNTDLYEKEIDEKSIKDNQTNKNRITIDNLEFTINSCSDDNHQFGYGFGMTITNDNEHDSHKNITMRINIINLINNIKKGCIEFLEEHSELKQKQLFKIIDFDQLKEIQVDLPEQLNKLINEKKDLE